ALSLENGTATLNHAGNAFSTLAVTATNSGTGVVSYSDSDALTLSSVTGTTLSSLTVAAGGKLTSSATVTAGAITLSGFNGTAGQDAVAVNGALSSTGTIGVTANGGGDL